MQCHTARLRLRFSLRRWRRDASWTRTPWWSAPTSPWCISPRGPVDPTFFLRPKPPISDGNRRSQPGFSWVSLRGGLNRWVDGAGGNSQSLVIDIIAMTSHCEPITNQPTSTSMMNHLRNQDQQNIYPLKTNHYQHEPFFHLKPRSINPNQYH